MKSKYELVVVGAGICGISAALHYRSLDANATILVVDEEAERPYKRTKLSKELANGYALDAFALYERSYYDERRIDVVSGDLVRAIDPDRRTIVRESGEIEYGKLLLATGSRAVVPGATLGRRSYVFWNKTQASELRAALSSESTVELWGAGVTAVELAEQMTLMGKKVRLFARNELPMTKELDLEASSRLKRVLTNAGVEWIVGSPRGEGILVAAIGSEPRTELAIAAGLTVDRGIVVDRSFRTSNPSIWAAGTCARKPNGTVAHLWHESESEGKRAAEAMLGAESGEPEVFRLKTEVFGVYFFSMNKRDDCVTDCVESRGDVYRKLYVRDGRLIGAVMVGDRDRAKLYENAVRENWSLDSVRSKISISGQENVR